MVDIASNLNLDVDGDIIEYLLEVVPEELTSEELLELEQMKRQKKRKWQQKKEEPPRKFTEKGLAGIFANFNKLIKKFEKHGPHHQKVFHNREECSWCISVYKQIYDEKKKKKETNQANLHAHNS